MDIRNMRIEDYEKVYALWLSCRGMGLNNVDDSREGIARYLARNPDTCFVAEEEGRILGVVIAGHDGRRGFIYHTAVAPDARGRGIGSNLVDAAVSALRDEGIAKAALLVFAENEGGNVFWEKQGFTSRQDIVYRNRALAEMVKIDT